MSVNSVLKRIESWNQLFYGRLRGRNVDDERSYNFPGRCSTAMGGYAQGSQKVCTQRLELKMNIFLKRLQQSYDD